MITRHDEKTSQPDGPATDATPDRRPRRLRRRILRSTAILPALLTVSNGLLGFAAIHMATRPSGSLDAQMYHLTFAAWLIFGAMVCDMLDGRVARLTRRTSDFGGQLDSLCDAISFGVAPAIITLRTSVMALENLKIPLEWSYLPAGRAVWCIGGAYVACSVLRLARFNVENEPDESAHMSFVGLPSPGAAAALMTCVLLFTRAVDRGWADSAWLLPTVGIALPVITLICALLMVSRIRYPHIFNQYLRGRRPFGSLVKMVILVLAMVLEVYVTAAVLALGFVIIGPASLAWRRLFRRSGKTAI